MRTTVGIVLLVACMAALPALAGTINVAEGKPVSLGSGTVYGAALSTLVDNVFLSEGTQWQSGTVWWYGTGVTLIINLGASYTINGAIVQGDNNDSYLLEYWNGAAWTSAWNTGTRGSWGMYTRPTSSTTTPQSLTPFTSSQLRVSAISGDNSYSLSEVQVFADTAIPEPTSIALMAAGALMLLARKRLARR